jgi:hypothetical protein
MMAREIPVPGQGYIPEPGWGNRRIVESPDAWMGIDPSPDEVNIALTW